MSRRSLSNPDVLTGTLYTPDGQAHQVPYEPTGADIECMRLAINEADAAITEGNVAVGAVMAYVDPRTDTYDMVSAHSTEITGNNLKAHAEDNVYEKVQPILGRRLSSGMLYVTTEPCNGCAHDYVIQGEVGSLYIATSRNDTPHYFREKEWTLDRQLRDAGRTILVVRGLLRDEMLKRLTPETKVHQSGVPRADKPIRTAKKAAVRKI